MANCDDVEHWDAQGLENVIGTMDGIHKSHVKLGETLEGVQANLSSWGGLTAESWHRYHNKLRVDLDDHGHQAKAVADKLRPLYDEVLGIKSRYRYLKATITGNGSYDSSGELVHWKLNNDGSINTGGIPLGDMQSVAAKQQLEDQMKALLHKADGVDAEIADALKAITTPGGAIADGPHVGQPAPTEHPDHDPRASDPTIAASAPTPGDQLPLAPKDGQLASPTMGTANNASPDVAKHLHLGPKASIAPLQAGVSADEWRKRLANYKPGDALPDPRTPTGDRSIDAIAHAAGQQGSSYAWGGNRNLDGPSTGVPDGGQADRLKDTSRLGYDCGGLVRYSVEQATPGFGPNGKGLDVGIGTDAIDGNHNLIRTNENGRLPSTTLNNSQAGPGDVLVFGGQTSGTQHTGLYLGNGFYINAPGSGMPVQVDDLRNRTPDFADVLRVPGR